MSKAKITDLRREVKERLNKKGVVDLSEYKLKPIDLEEDNKKIRNQLERNLKKIGNHIVTQVSDTNMTDDDKIEKLNELLNGDIRIKIRKTESSNVKRLVKSFNKGVETHDTYLEVIVEEGSLEQSTFSTLYFEPTKSQEGYFTFKYERSNYIPFASFKKLIGTLYFFNKLREYIKSNKEMTTLIYLKYILLEGIYKDKEHKSKIDKLAKKYNLPESQYVNYFICEETSYRKSILEEIKHFDYLDWIENNNYFSLDSIFSVSSYMDRYLLYSIKNVALSSCFFNHIYELNIEEEYDVKEEINISSDYAKSYETKKNIPQKVLDKMESTSFKKHFGYVEFDELVDLEKVETLEKEWDEINKKVLFPIAKDHSLRFRRLGKYRASGLYFSGMKAVCIDLAGPSSLVHELMHMIDYTTLPNTILSSMFNFRGIIERYRTLVNNKVDSLENENSFKITWNGKSKYNKEYYLSIKEIFARCGEIYIANILGIESSLVKANDKILYPRNDEFLLELIEKYYSSIIQIAPNKKEDIKVASNSKVMTKEEVNIILNNNQISIFEITGVI